MATAYFLCVILISVVMLAMKITATNPFLGMLMYAVFRLIPILLIVVSALCLALKWGYELPNVNPIL